MTLKVGDVSVDGRPEHALLRVIGKGDKEREIPIVPRLRDILLRYLAEARPALIGDQPDVPWFFVNAHPTGGWRTRRAGRPLLTRTLFGMMRRRVSPIAGRPVNPHLLRHCFASRLRSGGAPLELVQEALGHASIQTTTM